jgi:hypothetical protein
MTTDPQPVQTERFTILSVLIDSMTLYAASQYPTAETVELVSLVRTRHAQHAARQTRRSNTQHKFAFRRSSMNDIMQRILSHPALALFARYCHNSRTDSRIDFGHCKSTCVAGCGGACRIYGTDDHIGSQLLVDDRGAVSNYRLPYRGRAYRNHRGAGSDLDPGISPSLSRPPLAWQ